MRVGVMPSIDITVELSKLEYMLDEPIIGKFTFNSARIQVKAVELYLVKVESYYKSKNLSYKYICILSNSSS